MSIDILQAEICEARGARIAEAAVVLTEPWGYVEFRPIRLAAGWYSLDVDADAADVCVQLTEESEYALIELSASAGRPAYVRLAEGTYRPSLRVGVRPDVYKLLYVRLRPISLAVRGELFARRLLTALRGGVSPAQLRAWAARAFRPPATYGVRAGTGNGWGQSGLVHADRIAHAEPGRPVFDVTARLSRLASRPVFWVTFVDRPIGASEAARLELDRQVYPDFSLDETHPYDFVVRVGADDRLTPDALLLLAETIFRNPEVSVIIADAWCGGMATARVAFDPLLYGDDDYPTPCAVRKGFAFAASRPWVEQQAMYAVVGVPVAVRPAADRSLDPATKLHLPSISGPAVTVVIPTRDRADLLSACLAGLFDNTAWPHEVVIVDNGSENADTFALFEAYREKGMRVVRADIPFNFSTLCNLGAEAASHAFLCFVNNDVVFSDPGWLERLMAQAVKPDAGAVGARLCYADGRLQHGGVALGLTEICGHLWRGLPQVEQDHIDQLSRSSLRSAVTAAVMCINKDKFDAVGGFDEVRYPVTLNDVDICLRLQRRGWYSIYAADARAFHLEGESRGADRDTGRRRRRLEELRNFSDAWSREIAHDPWFPDAFMRSTERGELR